MNLSRYDGLEQRVSTIDAWYSRHGGYLSANVNLWPRPMVLFASAKLFASLTPLQQRALRQAATGRCARRRRTSSTLDRDSAGNICRAGFVKLATATDGDLMALRRAVQPVYSDLERDPGTRRAITAIEQLKRGSAQAPPSALGACRAAPSALGGRTPGRRNLGGHHPAQCAGPDFLAENWGKWIYVFDRGRFADTQENKQACTWGYGTYAIKRDTVEWTFKDGGGRAPNGAFNKPGEFFVFDWSRYHDTLTLSPVKGKVSPSNFRGAFLATDQPGTFARPLQQALPAARRRARALAGEWADQSTGLSSAPASRAASEHAYPARPGRADARTGCDRRRSG